MDTTGSDQNPPRPAAFWRVLHRIEDVCLALSLAGVVAFPLLELVLRSPLFQSTLIGGNAMTQHCTLLVSIFGAMVAARAGRLLSISPGFANTREPWGTIFELIRAGTAAGVTAVLAGGAWLFFGYERDGGRIIAFGIPGWIPLLLLAVGLAVITVRLLVLAGNARRRIGATVLGLAIAIIVWRIEPFVATWTWVMLGLLLVAVVLGAPIFVLLGGAAAFLYWGDGYGLDAIAGEYYGLSTNPLIPSLPLFTLAGYFLAEGGTSTRMIRLLRALVGDLRAGPAIVTVLSCAFFTSLTGASGVTILALGGLLVPFLLESRYNERQAIGALTGVGSIGLLFAPCLPLIFYAIIAQVEIKAMFVAGIAPGLLLVLVCVAWGTWTRPPASGTAPRWKFDTGELWRATWAALPELLIPVVSLGAIFSGLATPVEAAAITAVYTLLIEVLIYRELKPGKLLHAVNECGLLIGGVLLILGVAKGLTQYLILDQVPETLVAIVTAHITSPLAFIALLNVVLLLVGCLMDVFSAIIVVVPLITAVSLKFGIDPIHLGILFLANLGLGFLTPPVGMNLFLSSLRFKKSMGEVLRGSLPYFWLQLIVVLVISYWPDLSLALPRWLGLVAETMPPP